MPSVPSNIPTTGQQIPTNTQGPPTTGQQGPPISGQQGSPSGTGQQGGAPSADCSQFASVPSCSMTGAGEAMCKQCFPNK